MKLKVKVGPIGILDMLKFKNLPKTRQAVINEFPAKDVSADFIINADAAAMHPDKQIMEITDIIEHKNAGAKTFVFKRTDGKKAAYFRAGQYISVSLKIGNTLTTRPYSISSAPLLSKEGKYEITVKENKNGFAANYIVNEWKKGDTVTVSAPQGNFYYEKLRDEQNIVAIAGGSGITPFLSMAKAIEDGSESFNLTLLYGSKTQSSILFKDELDKICNECDKVKVIYVISGEEAENCESGFITADIIKKYAPDSYSVFMCGPESMYHFLEKELAKLNLPAKNIRREMLGVTKNVWLDNHYPAESMDKKYSITVITGDSTEVIKAASDETVLTAVERAGIAAPSHCRSGECGWCRTKLISGEVFCPPQNEYRRWADKQHGYIHPCCSFPLSDLCIELAGTYQD